MATNVPCPLCVFHKKGLYEQPSKAYCQKTGLYVYTFRGSLLRGILNSLSPNGMKLYQSINLL